MIIFIITICLIVIGIIGIVLEETNLSLTIYEIGCVIRFLCFLIGIIGFCVCIFGGFIANRTNISKEQTRIELNGRIEEINSTYNTLITYEDNAITRVQIVDYNSKVSNFKKEIKKKQVALNSCWVNIFVSPIYNEYTGNEVKYIGELENDK